MPALANGAHREILVRNGLRPRVRRLALPVLAVVVAVAAWHLVAVVFFTRDELPLPGAVARQMWADRTFYGPHIRQTMGEAALGYVWGVGIALLLGAVFVVVPAVERVALRIVVATYCLPLIAAAPILQIVLSADAAKAVVAAQATLLVTLVGITLGLRSADRTHLDVVHCLGGGEWRKLVKIRLRSALPGIFTGLKIAAPSALLGAVIGEFLGGTRGLGVAMITSQQAFFVERTWGLAIVMGVLAAVAFAALAAIGRWLAPWQQQSTLNVGATPTGAGDGSLLRRTGVSLGYLVLSAALGLALWAGLIRLMDLSPFFAKSPTEVWRFLFDGPEAATDRGELVAALRTTLANAALGYLVGTVGALAMAMVVVASATVERVVMPIAVWLRSVPLVAMTPLIALVFGRGLACALVMAGLVTFFPSLVSLVEGLRAAPAPALDLVHGYGAGRAAALAKVRLPYALPSLFASARVAAPLAILGALLAEWLATGQGIGNYMVTAQGTAQYTAVWASVAVVTVVSVALYGAAGAVESAVSRRFTGAPG
jgi:sulfonate transport system permease protein